MPVVYKPRFALAAGWDIKENGWGEFMTQNICKIDNLLFPAVESVGTPPPANTVGGQYIDADGNLQTFVDGAYVQCAPKKGMLVYDCSTNCILAYNGTVWFDIIGSKGGGGGSSIVVIDDLLDVNSATAADGQVLIFNAGVWSAADLPASVVSISDLSDVNTLGIVDGQTLCFDALSGTFIPVDKEQGEDNVCCLPDPTGLTVLQSVVVDATGTVVPSDIATPELVANFVVVEIANGEVCLQSFGPRELDSAHGLVVGDYYFEGPGNTITNVEPTSGVNNVLFRVTSATKIEILAGTRPWEIGAGGGSSIDVIDELLDVDTTTALPALGEVLTWDGTNWVPAVPTGAPTPYLHAMVSTTNPTTTTPVVWDTVIEDNVSGLNAGGTTYTFQEDGIYSFTSTMGYSKTGFADPNAVARLTYTVFDLATTTTTQNFFGQIERSIDSGVVEWINSTGHRRFLAGDTIQIFFEATGTSFYNDTSWLTIVKVGD